MAGKSKKQRNNIIMSGVLLVLMLLSVVALSYSPTNSPQSGNAPDDFSYNGYDFEYVQIGQGAYQLQTTVDGLTLQFSSRPQDVSRLGIPNVFADQLGRATQIVLKVAENKSQNSQEQYIQNFLQGRLQQTTVASIASTTYRENPCVGAGNNSVVLAIQNTNQTSIVEQETASCYTTNALDDNAIIVADYIAYASNDII